MKTTSTAKIGTEEITKYLTKEDVAYIMNVAEMIASHTNRFELKILRRIGKLEINIKELESEVKNLKK